MGVLGKYHTLKSSIHLGRNLYEFIFPKNLKIRLIVHDPDRFYVNPNPAAIPKLIYDLEDGHHFLYIEVIHHIKMNRPGYQCEEDDNYSFSFCLKQSVTNTIGCRLKLMNILNTHLF